MNLSEIFIRRPSPPACSWRASRCSASWPIALCRSAICRRWTTPPERQRRPARRRSRHDGVGGGEPARASVHDDRRPRLDDVARAARAAPTSPFSLTSARHRQRNRGRPDSDRRGDAAAAGRHAVAAVVPQEQPGGSADPDAEPDRTRCDVARRLRRDDDRAAHLDGERRLAGDGPGASKPSVCRSIPTSFTRSTSASTKSIRRCRTGTSTSRPGNSSVPSSTWHIKASGQLMNADAFKPVVVAYRRGAPVRPIRSRTSSTASRT